METTNTSENKSLLSQLSESTATKLLLIGLLTLILLIPSSWIQSLISERESRNDEAIQEIAQKWSGNQSIEGPVMQLPIKTFAKVTDALGKVSYRESESTIYLLPENLTIKADANPEILHRGIFDAVVYNSKINLTGNFSNLELRKSGINPENVIWDRVKIITGISDLKGLKNTPRIKLSDSIHSAEPDFSTENVFKNNLAVLVNLAKTKTSAFSFSYDLDLRGSGELSFLHVAKNTSVNVTGKWGNPSFIGNFLPDDRKINKNNFTSEWKMSNFNRPFPQQWQGSHQAMEVENRDKASFGVKFLLPVDQYQKTMRSAKYSILVIILSFVSLFFIELLKKTRINLLQYVLIGAAMIIYYALLLSFSEQVGFDFAYLIASLATITLISIFIGAFLRSSKPALAFSLILGIFYSFIYIIIQLQDLALLFGSIGLFITIACLMYFSVKINWSKPSPLLPSPLAGNP
ncbi:MAG: cell envelope integrity protein CreD [Pedobacter sp.]|nr:MAG: cell envelope integrity protein CreD [Pedobacter sp.]